MTTTLKSRLDTFVRRGESFLYGGARRLIGAALLRILIGAAAVNFYVANMRVRGYWFGPRSYNEFVPFGASAWSRLQPSLYAISRSDVWFNAVFFCGFAVALLFMIYGGRGLAVAHAVFMLSLYWRNQMILDGGDNFASIAVLLLPFLITDAYFSPKAKLRRAALAMSDATNRLRRDVRSAVHNVVAALLVFQTAVVYMVAGYWKLGSANWRAGDALYFVTRVGEFHFSGAFSALLGNVFVAAAMAYFIVIAQITFAPLVFSRRWAFLGVAAVAAMHLGIIGGMGLVSFGLTMIGADMLCVGDAHYISVAERARSLWAVAAPRMRWFRPGLLVGDAT